MLGTLIKKEITETILDLRFVVATLLCIVLIPLGMYVSIKDYEHRLEDYQSAVQQYEQRSKEGYRGGDFRAEGYRPPSPLSVFSRGVKDLLNVKVTTQHNGDYSVESRLQETNLQGVLFGKIDFAYIIATVLSLLALVLTFSTITGEKESGTLRLITANSVARWKILFSKIVGNYLVFLGPFAISILTGLLILQSSDVLLLLSSKYFIPIFVMLIVTLLFLFCMFNLGTLISTLMQNSIVSMVAVLFVWVLLALVVPKMSPMIAEIVVPVRSRQVVNTEKSMLRSEIERQKIREESDLFRKILRETGVGVERAFEESDETKVARDAFDKAKVPIEQKYNKQIDYEMQRIEQDYSNRIDAQAVITRWLSRISPICCLTYTLSEISGTGAAEMNNLKEQARQFQETVKLNFYDNFVYDRYGFEDRWSGGWFARDGFDPGNSPLPHMSTYRHISLAGALSVCWVDIVLLVLFSVLFFAGALVSFLRYDVR